MRVRRGLPLRLRLTVIYGLTFVVCGGGLLATAYALMAQSLDGMGSNPPKVVPTGPPHADGSVTLADGRTVSGEEYRREAAEDATRRRTADQRYRDGVLGALLTRGSIALAAMTPVALGLCWVAAGRGLRPLRRVTDAARRIADTPAEGLSIRIDPDGPRDEVRDLAEAFDAMLARLDASFAAQRRFVANAAHELRTPLAIDRTVLEVSLDGPDADVAGVRERLLATNQRQARMLDGLLALARAEHVALHREPVDLAALLGAELAAADTAGLRVSQRLEPAVVDGEPTLLALLARNLLSNAVRYNVPDGWLRVDLATRAGRPELTVANSGPAVDAADVAGLFEPFRRGVAQRTGSGQGTGLGLSIVRAVAHAHGGDVAATPAPDGGLAVRVTFGCRNSVVTGG